MKLVAGVAPRAGKINKIGLKNLLENGILYTLYLN